MARKITELNSIVEFDGAEIILARQGAEDKQGSITLAKEFFLEEATTILPDMTGATGSVSVVDIGSPTQQFRNIYADEVYVGASSLYVNGKKVIEDASNTMTFSTDPSQSMHIKTTGAGGNLHFFSDDQINATANGGIEWSVPSDIASKNMNFTNSSVGGNINFNAGSDAIVLTTSNGVNVNANLNIQNNLVVTGDLTVNGTTTSVNTATVEIEDNIIEINSNQTGTPAGTLRGGIVVNRGDETDYEFVFVESDDLFKVGMVGQLQAVATRQDSPTPDAIPVWNDTASRFDTSTLTVSGSTITGSVTGNAGTANSLATARNIALAGDVTGNTNFDGSDNVTITATVANNSHTHTSANITDATHTNVNSMIVRRDASGNFAAGTITAALSGNASTATKLATARNIALTGDVTGTASFDGSANASITATVANDSHTHDTRYFTETEITTNYYNKTQSDARYVVVTSGASFPGGAALGDEVYRTDLDEWYKYNGTVWTQI